MAFEDLVAGGNKAILDIFGAQFTFMRVGQTPPAEPQTITGILKSGIEPEDRAPGDGSTYALIWMSEIELSPPASKGDEISSPTFVYKIVRPEMDEFDGIWYLLRLDRAVS